MSKITRAILLLVLVGCTERPPERKAWDQYRKVDMKFCIDQCLEHKMRMFHSTDSQFLGGAASSSMGGIQETAILDKLTNYCEHLYGQETCVECIKGPLQCANGFTKRVYWGRYDFKNDDWEFPK